MEIERPDIPNPYASPGKSANRRADRIDSQKRGRVGPGYFLIVAVNCVGLVASVPLFAIEISGDGFAPMWGIFIGIPLILVETFLGGLPAVLYCGNLNGANNKALAIPIVVAAIAIALSVIGVVCSFVLPGGSAC